MNPRTAELHRQLAEALALLEHADHIGPSVEALRDLQGAIALTSKALLGLRQHATVAAMNVRPTENRRHLQRQWAQTHPSPAVLRYWRSKGAATGIAYTLAKLSIHSLEELASLNRLALSRTLFVNEHVVDIAEALLERHNRRFVGTDEHPLDVKARLQEAVARYEAGDDTAEASLLAPDDRA